MKKFLLILVISLLIGAGCKVQEKTQDNDAIIQQLEQRIDELEKEIDEQVEKEVSQEDAAPEIKPESVEVNIPAQPESPDYDQILINYKLDVINSGINDLSEILFAANYEIMCPNVVANKTSGQHAYYMFLDAYNDLVIRYAKYRYDIEYIDNNLFSHEYFLDMFRDGCESVGHNIR